MVYRNKTFANSVVVGLSSGKVELAADSGDLLIKSGGSTATLRPGLGFTNQTAFTTVANKAALPLPPSGIDDGSLYYTTASSEMFMKSGGGWYRVSMVNTSPSISLDVTSATISSTTPLDITYTVTEPEGTPTTVAITDGIPDSAVTITHTTSNNHVRAVFDGSTALTANTITFTATDGVNTGVATCTINASYFNGVFAMWADGTVIKAHAGASVATNGTTSQSDSSISRSGLQIADSGDYISFTGLPAFKFDPSSSQNYIVWAMKFPTPLDTNAYGMIIRDDDNYNIAFIERMRRFHNSYGATGAVNSRTQMRLLGNNGSGTYNQVLANQAGFPNYGSNKYWVYVIDSSNASVVWVKEVGGSGLLAQLQPTGGGEGRTGFAGSADNQITFFGGSPHNNSIANVSGGSNNEGAWKIDVAAVAVYPGSFGNGGVVATDFASVIASS
tara:strand:- start:52 stop:1386 length:1335 start_codon:yes stop_codon:yes gene_type:complete